MKKNIQACLSRASDNWRTPSAIYGFFMDKGYIDLFPFKSDQNQYDIDYKDSKLFCNPPFSQLNLVVDYLYKQWQFNNEIALLIPVRTDTIYFQKLFLYFRLYMDVYFIHGRLKYNDEGNAPFPSMLIIIRRRLVNIRNPEFEIIYPNDIKFYI